MRLAAHFWLPFFRALASSKGFVLFDRAPGGRSGRSITYNVVYILDPGLALPGDFQGSNSGHWLPYRVGSGRRFSPVPALRRGHPDGGTTPRTVPPGRPGPPRQPGRGPPENPLAPRARWRVSDDRGLPVGVHGRPKNPQNRPERHGGAVPGSRRGASGRDDNLASLCTGAAWHKGLPGAYPRSLPWLPVATGSDGILCFLCLTFRTCGVLDKLAKSVKVFFDIDAISDGFLSPVLMTAPEPPRRADRPKAGARDLPVPTGDRAAVGNRLHARAKKVGQKNRLKTSDHNLTPLSFYLSPRYTLTRGSHHTSLRRRSLQRKV